MKNKLFLIVLLLVINHFAFAHGDDEKTITHKSEEIKRETVVVAEDNTLVREIYIEVEKKETNKKILILVMMVNVLTLFIVTDEVIRNRKIQS